MRFKVGDLEPAVVINCTDNGTAVNLTAATSVTIRGTQNGVVVVNDTSPTRDNAAGKVTHTWQAPESATAGRIWFRAIVTWPGARPQTFPPAGELAWDIEP